MSPNAIRAQVSSGTTAVGMTRFFGAAMASLAATTLL